VRRTFGAKDEISRQPWQDKLLISLEFNLGAKKNPPLWGGFYERKTRFPSSRPLPPSG
jgi:hypothetical protein